MDSEQEQAFKILFYCGITVIPLGLVVITFFLIKAFFNGEVIPYRTFFFLYMLGIFGTIVSWKIIKAKGWDFWNA